jgi:hypothetical protein
MKSYISLSALMLMLFGAQAYAVPCSDARTGVFLTTTSPQYSDVAYTQCEDGSGNDPYPDDLGPIFGGMTYEALQKLNYGSDGLETVVDINLVVTPAGAATDGTWSFTNIEAYTDYVIVLKDGGAGNPSVDYSAYLLDPTLFGGNGSTWSGDWIYGYNYNGQGVEEGLKNLSHLTVYGKFEEPERPPGEGEVPAPGALILFGTGLVLMRRRRMLR